MVGGGLLAVTLFLGWVCIVLGQSDGDISLPCVKTLLPCRPFIGSSTTPTPMCCEPLRQMLNTEVDCLCAFFNNVELMHSLNITKDDALKLPKACDEDASLSLCNSAANGTSSPGPVSKTNPIEEQGNIAPTSKSSGHYTKKGSWINEALLAAISGVFLSLEF